MYKKVSTDLNFIERELEVLDFWKRERIFEKSVELRAGCPTFTFYDGPPTANGRPHIGHVETRAFKDLIPRYRTMKGCRVLRKAGWDTHGLPVELEVEKELGLDGKPQIEAYGVEKFIERCKHSVWKYQDEWERMSDRVALWLDMKNPYVTYHNDYIESVWWSLKELWDKGLIYRGHKVVPYCPRCGTALSSHEVAQGYKDVTEPSIYVRFQVRGREGEFILAWTTTPWTLPSNAALCVNPKEDYVRVKKDGQVLILAAALCDTVLGGDYTVLESMGGRELVGLEYEPLFPWADLEGARAHFVVADGYVTLTDGTGVVHTAPAFGEDDARVARAYDLPFIRMVDDQGRFVPQAELIAGLFVKDADPVIIGDLKNRGLLYKQADYEHSYPFCWRCDTPLLYYARSTWFIRTTALRDQLLENNRNINWLPENIRDGRMGNFLENLIDWGVSRERYWGTPLPIWECACGHQEAVGSIAQLREQGRDVPADIELHKPYIDRVELTCSKCGGAMKRVPEVIDCWYDSGSMPFAQWHYPFENKDVFLEHFPAQFISEAVDQTRGWFFVLLAISTLLFGRSSFETCLVLGHVNDKDGAKMSKHKGNVVDPWDVLDKQGADAVRWYFFSCSAPWLGKRFYDEAISEVQRKFMGTLWNTYAFYVLYANIDNFNPREHALDPAQLPEMDRWVLSRLNTLVRDVDRNMENYRITESARQIEQFVDELSNWYVRRCRERYWQGGMAQDKINAYMTLYTVLETLTRLIAPFVPFMAESIYQNLVRAHRPDAAQSVHLCDFPAHDDSLIDAQLERDMDLCLAIVTAGRACRNQAAIKNRQPVSALYVQTEQALPEAMALLIKDELNVKEIRVVSDASAFTAYRLKPQMRTLGPRYGKLLGRIGQALGQADGAKAVAAFAKGEPFVIEVDGQAIELSEADVLVDIQQREGYVASSERSLNVVLDTNLTPELIDEGLVREIVSKLQTMRKEAGFEVTDRIRIAYSNAGAELQALLMREGDGIAGEVLAVSIEPGELAGAYSKAWSINGLPLTLAVVKV